MQGFWNLIGKSGQGPGKDFQYDIGEKLSSNFDSKSIWSLHHGKKRTNGDIVTVFACDGKTSSPDELHLAKTSHKRLKTLRHPNIIKYIDGFESENLVYVVTEPVIPLSTFLDEEDGRNANLITWGLHQVTSGLSFLINNGNLIHDNVNIFSIFVGLDGEWKLGGVEYVHPVNSDGVAKLPYLTRYDPPNKRDGRKNEIWSTDAWGLGCLIWEIYNSALQNASDLKNINKIPKPLVVHYCDLVSANPKNRTNPKVFLERCTKPGQFLKNEFINANLFLQEIQIKDQAEQKEFFLSLDKSLDNFPKQFCIHKVLPQLLNAFEFGSAGSAVLSPLFKVGLLLDDAAYQSKILPCIIKLFSSNDRSTRIQLLQQMEKFVKHLQPAVVDNQIFGCVATGFGDTLPAMREQTVKAMLLLAPKLSEKTINNQLLRYFAKLQMDEQPGIRTNTTICLGKVAPYLSQATRQKVLAPAFTRAIRDPFPPARSAGIMAIAATQEYYSMPEVATKILPALCCLTVDPEKTVRGNAFRVIKSFVANLEKYSSNPESALNNKEVAEKEAKGGTWTGWAVSSLTSRFYQPRQNREGSQTEKKETSEEKPMQQHLSPPVSTNQNESDASDMSDYGDALGDEDWQDPQDDFTSVKNSMMSAREDLSGFSNRNEDNNDKNDSDSDYGDWGGADNWEGNDSWTAVESKASKKACAKKTSVKENDEDKSVAELLGMDTSGGEFLNENTPASGWDDGWNSTTTSAFSTKPFTSSKTSTKKINEGASLGTTDMDGWGDNNDLADSETASGWDESTSGWDENTSSGWDDANNSAGWEDDFNSDNVKSEEELKKERKKEELQRKREERKMQRELANKEKKSKPSGGGALKLGAVKKTTR